MTAAIQSLMATLRRHSKSYITGFTSLTFISASAFSKARQKVADQAIFRKTVSQADVSGHKVAQRITGVLTALGLLGVGATVAALFTRK